MFKSLAFAGLLLALLPDQVSAQAPTQAQRDAIRAACRFRISWPIVPASSPAARKRSSASFATTQNFRRLAGGREAADRSRPSLPRPPSRPLRHPQLQRNPRPRRRLPKSNMHRPGLGRPGRSPERRAQDRATGLHPQRLCRALFLACTEQSENSAVPERQCGRFFT